MALFGRIGKLGESTRALLQSVVADTVSIGAIVDESRKRLLNPDISDAIADADKAAFRPSEAKAGTGDGQPAKTGFLGGTALADAIGIHATRRDAFFRQLERQRMSLGDDCWHEVRNPRPNSPSFSIARIHP